ncbi:hypothetical protein Ciccas_006089, partial [Cichlidogyrus casuarinus]
MDPTLKDLIFLGWLLGFYAPTEFPTVDEQKAVTEIKLQIVLNHPPHTYNMGDLRQFIRTFLLCLALNDEDWITQRRINWFREIFFKLASVCPSDTPLMKEIETYYSQLKEKVCKLTDFKIALELLDKEAEYVIPQKWFSCCDRIFSSNVEQRDAKILIEKLNLVEALLEVSQKDNSPLAPILHGPEQL